MVPASFITIIVKEKINNSKHFMRLSGMNIAIYWIINFLFDLIKYYFTCGICILLLLAFDFYADYLYILYLIYSPTMILMTYMLSFSFNTESGAQNYIILFNLLNLLIGALSSNVILILRYLDNVKNLANYIQNYLSLWPSFCFNFGYLLLLRNYMILMVEFGNWYLLDHTIFLRKFNLLLSPINFLVIDFLFYIVMLMLIETFNYCFCFCYITDYKIKTNIIDHNVLKERT